MYRWDLSRTDPDWLVRREVLVLWEGPGGKGAKDGVEYRAKVVEYDQVKRQHRLKYADGQLEWETLAEETVWVALSPGEVPPEAPRQKCTPPPPPPQPPTEPAPPPPPAAPLPAAAAAVGQRVLLLRGGAWRPAALTAHDPVSGLHRAAFDDGGADEELDCGAAQAAGALRALGSGGPRGAALARLPQGLPLWGRARGFPAWPCLAVSEADVRYNQPSLSARSRVAAAPLAVQYFGGCEHGRLAVAAPGAPPPPDVALSLEDGLAEESCEVLRKGLARPAFLVALQALEAYLRSGQLADKMGGRDLVDEWEEEEEEAAGPPPPGSAAEFWAAAAASAAAPPPQDATLPWTLPPALRVFSLGRLDYIRPAYHTKQLFYPLGYAALRREPGAAAGARAWLCEVADGGEAPLFRVSGPFPWDDYAPPPAGAARKPPPAVAAEAAQPTQAWYRAMAADKAGKAGGDPAAAAAEEVPVRRGAPVGAELFGLTHRAVVYALQRSPGAPRCAAYGAWEGGRRPQPPPASAEELAAAGATAARSLRLPAGVAAVAAAASADRCAVCSGAEEWQEDQLVQCDGCHILLHQRCYGIAQPPDGGSWLCDACALRLPAPPPCVLCPVSGGALKATTCGRWAHVVCAQWIPETSFVDTEAVGPIDGCARVAKARTALRCGLCRQQHGACIQCAGGRHCFATYHPLCARARGYLMDSFEAPPPAAAAAGAAAAGAGAGAEAAPAAAGGKRARSRADKGLDGKAVTGLVDGFILASFCPKCRASAPKLLGGGQATPVKPGARKRAAARKPSGALQLPPAAEPEPLDGCARTRPLDWSTRRLRREPAALAAFLAKRAFVEAMPYVVSGRRSLPALAPPLGAARPPPAPAAAEAGGAAHSSVAQRFGEMRASLRARLTCGKSAIHGWGAFTKAPHAAGQMVIEYCGELLRPAVSDARERRSYDALVGAGTYIFRRDESGVVDATRAGNMAHLINHSCAPNCYSRLVSVGDGEGPHIVLFALRDIPRAEELCYDYRFAGEERLPCNCGAAACRGWVNIDAAPGEAEEEAAEEERARRRLPEGWRWATRAQCEAL